MVKSLILNIKFIFLMSLVANCNELSSYINDNNLIIYTTPFWKTNIAYIAYGIIIVVLVYFLIQYQTRSLRRTNQILIEKDIASKKYEKQRQELALKNKNITSSIQYAKKIQEAILPSDDMFKKILPDSFILFLPKDIVSGDFYWITEKNNKVFVSAVDCTGHGVPGAFMSLIGFKILENIIDDRGIENTFHKDEDDSLLKDGMDLSFCAIDLEKKQLEYAGAFNPLYLIRDNKLIETRADCFSIGLKDKQGKINEYTNHSIPLKKNDMLYYIL